MAKRSKAEPDVRHGLVYDKKAQVWVRSDVEIQPVGDPIPVDVPDGYFEVLEELATVVPQKRIEVSQRPENTLRIIAAPGVRLYQTYSEGYTYELNTGRKGLWDRDKALVLKHVLRELEHQRTIEDAQEKARSRAWDEANPWPEPKLTEGQQTALGVFSVLAEAGLDVPPGYVSPAKTEPPKRRKRQHKTLEGRARTAAELLRELFVARPTHDALVNALRVTLTLAIDIAEGLELEGAINHIRAAYDDVDEEEGDES